MRRSAQATGVELTERYGHITLPVDRIGAEDGGPRLEGRLRQVPGVLTASVNLAAQAATVEFDREATDPDKIRLALDGLGVAPAREDGTPSDDDTPTESWYQRNQELVWSLAAGALLIVAWSGERWLGLAPMVAIALYLTSYAFGGFDLVRHWVATLRAGRLSFDIDLLMLLAAIGAAVLGEWAEGAFLLFLFSLAHALEHYALGRARNAIKALGALAPRRALVLRDGITVDTAIEDVRPGDVVVVRSGDRVPVDGEVASGNSSVDQAPITGESVPVEKGPGDTVYAGTVNGDGVLNVTTTLAVGDRTLDRVVKMVAEAQTQKAPTQRFTERFERIFVPAVLVADLLLIFLPPLLGFWDFSTSFYRGMALLVAASPCALALGTPAAVLAGIAQAARSGVLIKGGAHLEQLGMVKAMAFDKTGTLTEGRPEVVEMGAADQGEDELLRVAAAVEQHSQHPLGAAVVRAAEERKLTLPEAGDVESVTARGIRSTIEGEPVAIGNLRLFADAEVTVPESIGQAVAGMQERGRSTMVVRHGARWLGVIGVADKPRPGVRAVLDELRGLGIGRLVMLTGDNAGVGEAVGREVGVDDVRAGLLPEDKVTAIQELLTKHEMVAMVGDGVNDAPALANATVGIAMGGAGTAVALETADVALMADDLGQLPFAVGLSRQARAVIRQNLWLSMGVIVGLVAATVSGGFGIGAAVLVHEGSTLLVIGNALRLLRYKL
ncbi:MAG: heavy metal translocating P-type ATPase [Gemmatimonadales bacterium]|nr:heavy metal translocating P-type ATPase [Gemmatimonadales bacterium]MDZ4389913.1 heavy metal translocating P-type ATPase [Gemmatimonadales bacterium]